MHLGITAWLDQAQFWHWWVLAVALMVLEMVVPGAYLLWMGIAAAAVGVVLIAAPDITWQLQLALFAVLSVIAVIASRFWIRRHPIGTDQPALNRRGEQYVGRTFTLTEPIRDGEGRLHVDDTTWRIRGADLDSGTQVQVVGTDGPVLTVERLVDEDG